MTKKGDTKIGELFVKEKVIERSKKMNKKIKNLIIVLLVAGSLFTATVVYAQVDLGMQYGAAIGLSDTDPWTIAARIIQVFLGFLGMLTVVLIIYGGWVYMTAGGDAEKINKAKQIIRNAAIGLLIIFASFGIVSFIVSRLLSATGAYTEGSVCGQDGACGGSLVCCGDHCLANCGPGGDPFDSVFRLTTATTPSNNATNIIKNARIKAVFNKQLGNLTGQVLADNFKVEKIGDVNPATGAIIDIATSTSLTGFFATSTREIIFTADGECGGGSTSTVCLPEWSRIKVTINSASGIESINNVHLTCSPSYPCVFEFSTDNRVDLINPTASIYPGQICAAEGGIVLAAGANKVSGRARDNNGLSSLYFYEWKQGDIEPADYIHFGEGNSNRSASSFYFASGTKVAGDIYNFKIVAKDLADNSGTASTTSIVRPGHCCNGQQDAGETGADCGGGCDVCGKATIKYVSPVGGFCSNDNTVFCRSNSDCGAGNTCDNATPNNKPGGLVTIGGENFGAAMGSVYFSSATTSGWVAVDLAETANACSGVSAWSDQQIIVVVPADAVEGPIKIETANGQVDTTDDANNPMINDFKITAFDRPGLCSLTPANANLGDAVIFSGISLLNSYAMFGDLNQSATSSGISTASTSISAVVPNLRIGTTTAFALKGNIPSNYLYFHKDTEPGVGPAITGFSPSQGAPGQYVTIFGRDFGRVKGVGFDVYFASSTDSSIKIPASYEFPSACSGNIWRNDRVTVKVPAGITNGDYIISIELGSANNTINTQGLTSSNFKVDSNLDLAPSLCLLIPETAQNNQKITLVGEYFGSRASGTVLFTPNLSVAGNNVSTWDINSATNTLEVSIPANAASGPVAVKQGANTGNSLNLNIGACAQDADCGGTSVCCQAGSAYAGECRSSASECNLVITSSVYEWEFTASVGSGGIITTGPRIDYFEPLVGNAGQYLTIYGSGFGAERANSSAWFAASTVSGIGSDIKEVSYDFPPVCSNNLWSDTRIMVKVPAFDGSFTAGNYYLRLKIGSSTIDSSSVIENDAHKKIFNASSTAPLLPSLCNISPFIGPVGSVVSVYGEYFNNTSTTTFNNLQYSSIYNFGNNNGQLSASSTIPAGAITGPVYLIRDGLSGNSLNFTVGKCQTDSECGVEKCCGAGTYYEGQCKSALSDCNLTITSSVYEWEFSTGPAAPVSTCSGYNLNQCSDNLTCPNSPGMCSPYNVTAVATGNNCDYNCNTLDVCKTDNCEYSQDLKKCVKIIPADYSEDPIVATSTPVCSLQATTTDAVGVTVDKVCSTENNESRWKILVRTSCPDGWINRGKENNLTKCIQSGDIGKCLACSIGFSCVKSGASGVCAIDKTVCPQGEFCNDSTNKCMKAQSGSCECCCRLGNGDQDCCAGLTCEGNCGSDLVNDQNKFGYCSGCAVLDGNTIDQAASNARCSCAGHANQICSVDNDHPAGVCRDNVCSANQNKCDIPFNGSYCCNSTCQGPVGQTVCQDNLSSCSGYNNDQCAYQFCPNSPGQCSTRAANIATNLGPCDNEFCKTTYTSSCASSTDETINYCAYDPGLNKCTINNESCFSVANSITTVNGKKINVSCGLIGGDAKWFYNYASSTLDLAAGTTGFTASTTKKQFIKDGDGILNGKFCIEDVAGNAKEIQCGSVGNQPKWYYNTDQTCKTGWTKDLRGNCAIGSYNGTVCSICPLGSTCENNVCMVGTTVCQGGSNCVSGECQKTVSAACECCCDKSQNDPTTMANPACCNNLTCGYMCGDDTNVGGDTGKGKCTGCATDADCNCPGTSGKYCDQTAVPGVAGGICRDCSDLPTSADCSNHSDFCCVDAMRQDVCRGNGGNVNTTDSGLSYCSYYHCNTGNNGCASTTPVIATSTFFATIYSDVSQCSASCLAAPSLGERCVKPDSVATASSTTEECDNTICKGFSCLEEDVATSTSACGTCCCDTSKTGAADQCKAINPDLECVAGRGSCTGSNRGLCCGCTDDSQCGIGNGCGTDTCCHPQPAISGTTPSDDADQVCRNSQILAEANALIDPATIAGNIFLVGAYPNENCPEDTSLVARGEQQAPTKFFARLAYNTKRIAKAMVRPVFKLFGSESALADAPVNYCAVVGASDYYNTAGADTHTVITFMPAQMLDVEREYFGIVKSGVKSVDGVGIIGENKTGILAFAEGDFIGSFAWNFTTLSGDLNMGICDIDHVSLEPESYLFRTTKNDVVRENDTDKGNKTFDTIADSDKVFTAQARSADDQVLVPFSDYNWSWSWVSTKNNVADFVNSPTNLASSSRLVRALDGVVDDRTNIVAQASVSGSNVTKSATSTAYVFVCENPWPSISIFGTWSPWKDISGSNVTNYELYYCRDAGKVGTADDLPAIQSDQALATGPSSKKVCAYGTNIGKVCSDDMDCPGGRCLSQSLKEVYYFRGAVPNVSGGSFLQTNVDGNLRVNSNDDKVGNKVTLSWTGITAPSPEVLKEYRIYYGTASRNYPNSIKAVSGSSTYTIDNLVNGTKYYFAITAIYQSGGESAYSNEVVAIPWDSVGPSPAPIFGNIATTTDGKLSVSWNNTAADATYYELLYKISDTCDGFVFTQPGVKTANRTYNLSNLREDAKYCLGLVSYDQYNNKSATTTKQIMYPCGSVVDGYYGDEVTGCEIKWINSVANRECSKVCVPPICGGSECSGNSIVRTRLSTNCVGENAGMILSSSVLTSSAYKQDCINRAASGGFQAWSWRPYSVGSAMGDCRNGSGLIAAPVINPAWVAGECEPVD
jgi:hypothetical protein